MASDGSVLMNLIVWITGVLVSLAVGFGMTSSTLTVPFLPIIVTQVAGWIVVVGTVISVILALFKR